MICTLTPAGIYYNGEHKGLMSTTNSPLPADSTTHAPCYEQTRMDNMHGEEGVAAITISSFHFVASLTYSEPAPKDSQPLQQANTLHWQTQ